MTSKRLGLLAVVATGAVACALPAPSSGKALDLQGASDALRQVTTGVTGTVQDTLTKTEEALRTAAEQAKAAKAAALAKAERSKAGTRATATDPATQPPLHGANPHGQGGVGVVDVNPSAERPLGSAPNGADSGEDVIVGRARGEKVGSAYNGHITILALFGSELAGVNSAPGETKNGPLQAVQTGVLDPLCAGATKVCLSVLTANSSTTATGSTNDFAIARASALGLGVGAAESKGTITEDANCQTASGSAMTANVTSASGALAQAANSSSTSKSCRGQAPQVANTSQVIGLGGVAVPIPSAGCANGVPDTVTGIPAVLPIVCNADDVAGAAAVREALDVFVLQVGGTSLAKETTAASESFTVAPAEVTKAQCSDGTDNDGDGKVDAADPGCHTDGNANNPASYNPNDNDESNAEATPKQCSDGKDNDGDGKVDAKDPGCHSDGNAGNPDSYRPNDDDESNSPGTGSGDPDDAQCSDNKDNDGDGKVDARDPGCHSDGDAGNPDSYDPDDDNEGGGGAPTGGQNLDEGTLPFTGSDVAGLGLAGLLLLGGGLLLRRREGTRAAL